VGGEERIEGGVCWQGRHFVRSFDFWEIYEIQVVGEIVRGYELSL
jgi:hypothetical protein